MTDRALMQELERLARLPNTIEDWKDLYETLEAYQQRCLARAIARSAQREDIMEAIRRRALES